MLFVTAEIIISMLAVFGLYSLIRNVFFDRGTEREEDGRSPGKHK